ncbi:MAG: phage tail sheath family protein, partial [Phototrophicales bacterium]
DQPEHGYLARAVQGFFRNGGEFCYVMPLRTATPDAMKAALNRLDALQTVDLICAPDIAAPDADGVMPTAEMMVALQQLILNYCANRGNLFALFDSLPGADMQQIFAQRSVLLGDAGKNCALYYPWIRIEGAAEDDFMPPCGHIAGIYRRTDYQVGVHKAPANE